MPKKGKKIYLSIKKMMDKNVVQNMVEESFSHIVHLVDHKNNEEVAENFSTIIGIAMKQDIAGMYLSLLGLICDRLMYLKGYDQNTVKELIRHKFFEFYSIVDDENADLFEAARMIKNKFGIPSSEFSKSLTLVDYYRSVASDFEDEGSLIALAVSSVYMFSYHKWYGEGIFEIISNFIRGVR